MNDEKKLSIEVKKLGREMSYVYEVEAYQDHGVPAFR
jgi:hypothetical protein